MSAKIRFLGAAQTVTGSKYLVQNERHSLLVDAGMFQGYGKWRQRNWEPFAEQLQQPPVQLSAVLLTHAHLDHCGVLPKLVREGFAGPVYCTPPTADLCKILLLDAAKIQEEDAAYRARKNLSKHKPPLPLYTAKDAEAALRLLQTVEFDQSYEVAPGATATWRRSGHIIGAAAITLAWGGKQVTFSGDLGRYQMPILRDPVPAPMGDLLVIESTYGGRNHPANDVAEQLAEIVNAAAKRGGAVIVPSFAVGRTQFLLYHLRELKDKKRIPDLPVIVDSPMATDATKVYRRHSAGYDQEAMALFADGISPLHFPKLRFVANREESKRLNSISEPMIIIAGSGMVTGGRVIHHLFHRISSPLNTVLLTGYQATGTKGALIQGGAKTIRLLKQELPIRARVETLSGASAHGDRDEMLRWMRESIEKYGTKPQQVAITHGEPEAANAFSTAIRNEFGVATIVPEYLQSINL